LIEGYSLSSLVILQNSSKEKVNLVLDKSGRVISNFSFKDVTELSKNYYEEHRTEFSPLEIPIEKAIIIFKNHFSGKEDSAVDQSLFIEGINVVFVSFYLVRYEWKKICQSRIIRINGHTGKSDIYSI